MQLVIWDGVVWLLEDVYEEKRLLLRGRGKKSPRNILHPIFKMITVCINIVSNQPFYLYIDFKF